MLFTMSVGVILAILAVSLISLYYGDFHSQRMQQQAIQAYWNARAGVERYCDARQLPDQGPPSPRDGGGGGWGNEGLYDFGASGQCQVSQDKQDLLFEGRSGAMKRHIRLLAGDPARKVEQP